MFERFFPQITYFTYKTCTDKWQLTESSVDFYDLTFVLEGNAVYCVDGKEHTINAGQAVFIKKGQLRKGETDYMVCAAFNFSLPSDTSTELPTVIDWANDPIILMHIKDINTEWLLHNAEYALKCNGLFMLIMHRLIYLLHACKRNYIVEDIKKYIAEHYTEPLTVAEISKFACLNKVYCGALFKKYTGMTIIEYLHLIRVNHADALLRLGEFNIGQIAAQTGFSDICYFSKIFKRYKGVSPKAIRR